MIAMDTEIRVVVRHPELTSKYVEVFSDREKMFEVTSYGAMDFDEMVKFSELCTAALAHRK